MTSCPQCQAEYDEARDTCPECGAGRAEDPITCRRCGQEWEGGDACPACGLLVAEVPCVNHPDRTAAGRCVLCSRALCDRCAHEERHVTVCEAHRGVPIIEGWAQVYSTTSTIEAQLLRDNLEAEGLDAQVYSQRDMMFNLDLGELSIVRLLVPVWEYGSAMRVIRERMDTQGEVAFACSACGEPFEPGTRECSACGATLV